MAVASPRSLSVHTPPWFNPQPPWQRASRGSAEAEVIEVPEARWGDDALARLRDGRFVPVFGRGATVSEAARVIEILGRAFHRDADVRAHEHSLAMLRHPTLGLDAHRHLAGEIERANAPAWMGAMALGFTTLLGANDTVREEIADAYKDVTALDTEITLASLVGGGERGNWRERYPQLCAPDKPPCVQVAARWFDFVMARRFSGLDALKTLAQRDGIDAPSRWLIESAVWISGDDTAREQMTVAAEAVVAPLAPTMPRLLGVLAREMSELLKRPSEMRWMHLQSAAARDHASAAIKHWLHAATEAEPEDASEHGALGPEPSRAGKAAIPARQLSEEFLLDWFVPVREPRTAVDAWAHRALRIYHRLRGASLIALGRDALTREGTSAP